MALIDGQPVGHDPVHRQADPNDVVAGDGGGKHPAAGSQMAIGHRHPDPLKQPRGDAQAGRLIGGPLRVSGRLEVRPQAGKTSPRRGFDGRGRGRNIRRVEAASPKAGFDLEMDRQLPVRGDVGVGQAVEDGQRPLQQGLIAGRDREAKAHRVGHEFGRNRKEDEDRH